MTKTVSIERVQLTVSNGDEYFVGAVVRYAVLERLAAAAKGRGVTVLAFGFGEGELRLVLEGASEDVRNVVRATKVGTTRDMERFDCEFDWYRTDRSMIGEEGLEAAVVWAHRAPVDEGRDPCPEASPWSSHRDILRYRVAPFYDARVLEGRVDPRVVHERAGGRALPPGWPPTFTEVPELDDLLRVSAAVCGVLPTDRRCFRLFVHCGRLTGWTNDSLAHALCLTPRRVRQLKSESEDRIELAMLTYSDRFLMRVP